VNAARPGRNGPADYSQYVRLGTLTLMTLTASIRVNTIGSGCLGPVPGMAVAYRDDDPRRRPELDLDAILAARWADPQVFPAAEFARAEAFWRARRTQDDKLVAVWAKATDLIRSWTGHRSRDVGSFGLRLNLETSDLDLGVGYPLDQRNTLITELRPHTVFKGETPDPVLHHAIGIRVHRRRYRGGPERPRNRLTLPRVKTYELSKGLGTVRTSYHIRVR